jgi:uncharacterized protein YybS (DUF2232 family)
MNFENLEFAGVVLAIFSFVTIAVGHVLVRRFHPKFGTRLGLPFFILGIVVLFFSIIIDNNLLSGILGIVGITTIWDGIEFFRQEKRVQKGHI